MTKGKTGSGGPSFKETFGVVLKNKYLLIVLGLMMITCIVNFPNKVGGAIASGVVGLVMGIAGYDGNLAVQSEGAMSAIVGLYNWLPLALFILMFMLALTYQVDKIRPQMEADLKARHGEV